MRERIPEELASGWSVYLVCDSDGRLVGFLALKPDTGSWISFSFMRHSPIFDCYMSRELACRLNSARQRAQRRVCILISWRTSFLTLWSPEWLSTFVFSVRWCNADISKLAAGKASELSA
jgi:hypothetical protein